MKIRLPLVLAVLAAVGGSAPAYSPPSPERPRLVVLTDISSLTAGEAEPDDGQSLIRLMLYTNDFDIEGLVASSNLGHGQRVRPELIRRVVDAYGEVRPNLLLHDDRYPPAEGLRDGIKAGQPVAGPEVPVAESVGEGKDTEASEWIIRVVDRPDPRPVWVVIWGGSADLAQALWKVRATAAPRSWPASWRGCGSTPSATRTRPGRGSGSSSPASTRSPSGGPTGGCTGAATPRCPRPSGSGRTSTATGRWATSTRTTTAATSGPRRWARCGASRRGTRRRSSRWSPTAWATWSIPGWGAGAGGSRARAGDLTDVPDTDLDTTGDPDPRMSSVYRWRPAFQADFAARLDWCVKPYAEANHPPIVRIAGDRERRVKAGDEVALDAAGTTDPDGDEAGLRLGRLPVDPGRCPRKVVIEGRDTRHPRVVIAPELAGKTIPILLSVTDRGEPEADPLRANPPQGRRDALAPCRIRLKDVGGFRGPTAATGGGGHRRSCFVRDNLGRSAKCRPALSHSYRGQAMPVVNVRITRDGVTMEQKRQVVAEITQTLQRVLGKRPEHTHVIIEEVDPENWGFAGMLTTEYRNRSE